MVHPFQASSIRLPLFVGTLVSAACSLTLGCSAGSSKDELETGGFISHVPGQSQSDTDAGASGTGGSSSSGDGDGDASEGDDGGAERVIAEADIIQVDGNRLYALSHYSGLSIVNIADPTNLKLVGNYRSSADPFEMYLEDGVAYIMYNGWYSYVHNEEDNTYSWQTTSRMQAVNVSDPADIKVIGDLEVPGQIADSRKVGDVIYLATHENGWCYGCDNAANSRVTSFDVADPKKFNKVDSVVFQTEEGWQRSISVTTDRIYVSGFTWSGDQSQGGVVDVVDISNPAGDLKKGASINIAGQIESRWQMDEFEGTLRVISQPGGWGTTNPPVVETFRVDSSSEFTRLASLEMVLPRPEDLRSVRFDGERAFAITFEQTDPLFTFDLSDPENPLQVGELEIPGWVYHMEPRGDRIYALGFDDANQGGSLHVSLFDISDMANPTQLDRVNFGGDWGGFAEDQDRIHKAFNILADEGLILVPFYGGGYDEQSCNYESQSGIQLVDMTTDSLTLRGVAPQVGSARRALLHEGTLFGIGDNAVQAFDIADRDAPSKLDQLDTARNVTNMRLLGDTMLRFGNDWWTGQTNLDFSRISEVETAQPHGELDLSALAPDDGAQFCDTEGGEYYYSDSYWGGQVYVHGTYAYVPRYSYVQQSKSDKWTYEESLDLYIVDISKQISPQLVGKFSLDPTRQDLGESFAGIVQTESALLIGRSTSTPFYDSILGAQSKREFSYDVIELSNPTEPKVVKRFEVPSLLASGGWGYGMSGCSVDMHYGWWGYSGYGGDQSALVSGDLVVSQHEEPLSDGSGRVRYYLDRIDVSDPKNPVLLPKVNIPGNVVHFDGDADRIVTIDYLLDEKAARSGEDCYRNNFYGYFDDVDNVCRTYQRRLNVLDLDGDTAVLKDTRMIDREAQANSIAISDDRIFYSSVVWNNDAPDAPPISTVSVLSYDSSGEISTRGHVELNPTGYWWGQLVARDGRAFMTGSNELTVIDATSSEVEITRHEMGGWGCSQLEVQDDVAYCAMGQFGVKSFDLN